MDKEEMFPAYLLLFLELVGCRQNFKVVWTKKVPYTELDKLKGDLYGGPYKLRDLNQPHRMV